MAIIVRGSVVTIAVATVVNLTLTDAELVVGEVRDHLEEAVAATAMRNRGETKLATGTTTEFMVMAQNAATLRAVTVATISSAMITRMAIIVLAMTKMKDVNSRPHIYGQSFLEMTLRVCVPSTQIPSPHLPQTLCRLMALANTEKRQSTQTLTIR